MRYHLRIISKIRRLQKKSKNRSQKNQCIFRLNLPNIKDIKCQRKVIELTKSSSP